MQLAGRVGHWVWRGALGHRGAIEQTWALIVDGCRRHGSRRATGCRGGRCPRSGWGCRATRYGRAEADWSHWTVAGLRPYADTVLEAFGPRRLMLGSDWPVSTLAADIRGQSPQWPRS
ncbi:amidohydrolase family protein [Streptomyces sp. NPDC059352]|uniref:amidohydrolase family protein n=1 Tax=Streptomyces sp. NPDC059352 TaxID=3346810 RepID=UPI0036ADBB81